MIRGKVRNQINLDREKLRESCVDFCRIGLGEIQKNLEHILISNETHTKEIALQIKYRRKASEEDIYRLSYAFIQSADNIEAFIQIFGALNVLVKELTCSNSKRTIAALECLCNLSLGEKHVCYKIINVAGFYIVTYLHNEDECIKRTSLWLLANLLATSGCNIKRLMNIKLLELLWTDYCTRETEDNICMDAAICLYLVSKNFQKEQQKFIRDNFSLKNPTSIGGEYLLLIMFNANLLLAELTEIEKVHILNVVLFNLTNIGIDSLAGKLKALYGVRIFGNLMNKYRTDRIFYETIQSQLSFWKVDLICTVNQLFAYRNDSLTLETLWLTKNWINLLKENNEPIEYFISCLKICK